MLYPVAACATDISDDFISNVESNYADYSMNRDHCLNTVTFQRKSEQSEWDFMMLSIGCVGGFDSIVKDLNKLFDKFDLRNHLDKVRFSRISIASGSVEAESPWSELIRYANTSDAWPDGVESRGKASQIYASDAVYKLLLTSNWLQPIQDYFSSVGCKSMLRSKRSFTEHILFMTKKQAVNRKLLNENSAVKSSYPYGFYVDLSINCE